MPLAHKENNQLSLSTKLVVFFVNRPLLHPCTVDVEYLAVAKDVELTVAVDFRDRTILRWIF